MQRRKFLHGTAAAAATLLTGTAATPAATRQWYEWRTYTFRSGLSMAPLETYLKGGLLPALNRLGSQKIGVFTEYGKPEPARLHVLVPYASAQAYAEAAARLAADAAYTGARQAYDAQPVEKPPFVRYSTLLMQAFEGFPALTAPAAGSRLLEWRTYEGYSEDAVRRKIRMFNQDEIGVFNTVGLHGVFFGEVLAGENLPCLSYLLAFRDMAERDENWKQFGANPDWKRISGAAEYANTVSNIRRIFLEPTPYSQLGG